MFLTKLLRNGLTDFYAFFVCYSVCTHTPVSEKNVYGKRRSPGQLVGIIDKFQQDMKFQQRRRRTYQALSQRSSHKGLEHTTGTDLNGMPIEFRSSLNNYCLLINQNALDILYNYSLDVWSQVINYEKEVDGRIPPNSSFMIRTGRVQNTVSASVVPTTYYVVLSE